MYIDIGKIFEFLFDTEDKQQIQKMSTMRTEFKRAKCLGPYTSSPLSLLSVLASNPCCSMVSARAAPWCAW